MNLSYDKFNALSNFNKFLLGMFVNSDATYMVEYRRKHLPLIHTFHTFRKNNSFKTFKSRSLKKFNKEINFIFETKSVNVNILNSLSKNPLLNLFVFQTIFYKHFNSLFRNNSSYKINFILNQSLDCYDLTTYKLFNLNFYSHWFKYNFGTNNLILPKLSFNSKKMFESLAKTKINNFYLKTDIRQLNAISITNNFYEKNSNTPINFSESSTNKYINFDKISDYCFFFLRKNRIFNKGRYSRNRQLYRTGFY
jgi:hypothetical protein